MASNSNFDNFSLSNGLAYLHDFDLATFQQEVPEVAAFYPPLPFTTPGLLHQHGVFFVETHLGAGPIDADDRWRIHTVAPSTLPTIALPQPVPTLPPRWTMVPQRPYSSNRRNYTPSEPVQFDVGNDLPGLNMWEALNRRFPGLVNRDNLVLQGETKAFSCRFSFPGYPSKSYQVSTRYWNENRDYIPLSQLARNIAKALKKYLDAIGTLTMDVSISQRWKVGPVFLRIEDIYLARLESVSPGSYQGQFYVVDSTA